MNPLKTYLDANPNVVARSGINWAFLYCIREDQIEELTEVLRLYGHRFGNFDQDTATSHLKEYELEEADRAIMGSRDRDARISYLEDRIAKWSQFNNTERVVAIDLMRLELLRAIPDREDQITYSVRYHLYD